jgi:hypothetical protein
MYFIFNKTEPEMSTGLFHDEVSEMNGSIMEHLKKINRHGSKIIEDNKAIWRGVTKYGNKLEAVVKSLKSKFFGFKWNRAEWRFSTKDPWEGESSGWAYRCDQKCL